MVLQPQQKVIASDALNSYIEGLMTECYTKFEESIEQGALRLLLYGKSGSGKTRALEHVRKPVFIHSFDPGGAMIKELQPLILSKDIIYSRKFERGSAADFEAWMQEYDNLKMNGFFSLIGTYVLDSLTLWAHALMTYILDKAKTDPKRKKVYGITYTREQRDYDMQQLWGVEALLDMNSLPCDLIVTGHLSPKTDETGERVLEYGVSVPGQFSQKTLNIFPEKWVTCVLEDSKGRHFKYRTKGDDKLVASTKIGSGVFMEYEEPNIHNLMVKAGFPYEDRPKLKF